MHDKLIDRLGQFIDLEREIRNAKNSTELGFVICNLTKQLIKYDTAFFLCTKRKKLKVQTISGISDFEPSAPIVQTIEAVSALRPQVDSTVSILDMKHLDSKTSQQCFDLKISELIVINLNKSRQQNTTTEGALILARNEPWQIHEVKLLEQLAEVISHARSSLEARIYRKRFFNYNAPAFPVKLWIAACLSIAAVLPIRQSIIAEGEITARSPTIISTATEGVIKEIAVRPNQLVTKGQLLVTLDKGDTLHRQNKAQKELELAQERLRKATQELLGQRSKKNVIAELKSDVSLKQLELDYIADINQKLELRASENGIVLFSSPKDWIGRAVNAGEKIMELASSTDKQFEIWVAANDAIELNKENAVKFFPNAYPLQAVKGNVETVSFFARATEEGVQSYRVLGNIAKNSEHTRLGMKGTARIYGEKVTLAYYLFRKPLSAIRQTVGI